MLPSDLDPNSGTVTQSTTASTSNTSEPHLECRGVNGIRASGHCKQCLRRCPNKLCQQCCRSTSQTCSHHHTKEVSSMTLTAPIPSQSRDLLLDSNNYLTSEQEQRRVVNRMINPQADRHAIKDLPREAVAHHNAVQLRTQAAKDDVAPHELTLCVWLKDGEALEIPVTALNFPRYALIESRSLAQIARDQLGPSWDLQLEVLRPGSLKWQIVDANIPLMYTSETTKLLIRKMGLPLESCVGIDAAIDSFKTKTKPKSYGISQWLQPDVPKGIWERSRDGLASTTSTYNISNIESDSDPEVEIIGTSKRKKEFNEDIESSPLARKKARSLQPFPAPRGFVKGHAKVVWHELFSDRFETGPSMRTAYKYRRWALDKEETLREWMKGKEDVTVAEAYHMFGPAYPGSDCKQTNAILVE
ncbi:uncharacterized protein MELLADRAFT_89927 [Melampsora larici-populina 98AG31]|uniref:Uncharacterized protein n=1 Tax=Melampsora larici-populina (strain 98AG31 / pathotype 3-4-7) TaxID=747676 RepID=F4RV50_MELLP|nr:uncharacterized protein MELLADRAFT_89927 [Melampsora larici-populina 98AG31]EGG03812.1 hypothetical protein MELLADRAFT_89927 [Melampsora larici-populina 98AG31]